jgi:hypothetical protein
MKDWQAMFFIILVVGQTTPPERSGFIMTMGSIGVYWLMKWASKKWELT